MQPVDDCTTKDEQTGYILEEHFVTLSLDFAQKARWLEGENTYKQYNFGLKTTYHLKVIVNDL